MYRYELNGVPLPYSVSSPLTSTLFPGLVQACRAQKAEGKGKRVFELQLVPSLINVLRPHLLSTSGEAPDAQKQQGENQGKTELSEKERKEELEKIAKGEVDEGMEWGSIVVFSCEADCVGVREEWVGVEWEAMLGSQQ